MDELAKWRHDVALTRLIRHLAGPALDQHRGWHSLILREFTLLPRRLPDDTALYLRLIRKNVPWYRRFKYQWRLRRRARRKPLA